MDKGDLMKKTICFALTILSLNVFATTAPNEAALIAEATENGVVTKTYVMESYSDEYQYCYQQIVVKKVETSGELISSDSTEHCRKIR